jgi:predicted transposase YbfD/YdcC
MVFCAASRRLRARDQWIGWTEEQRRRRLCLVVNNCRFLLLPHKTVPNLGSRSLRLTLDRLSADWQQRYGHPVVLIETFVDPEQFCGTVYTAQGWQELGKTDGFGRVRRDFYVQHNKPKRLLARELCKNARRSLQAEKLKPTLLMAEAKPVRGAPKLQRKFVSGRASQDPFGLPPAHWGLSTLSLIAMALLAHLCGAAQSKDLVKFMIEPGAAPRVGRSTPGRRLSRAQSADLCRMMQHIDGDELEKIFLQIQTQLRGPAPAQELIVLDGKEPRQGGGHAVLTAVTVPSQHFLGSAIVDTKTNEIPVARELFKKLDLDGRKVSLDALHTQDHARDLVLEHGADICSPSKQSFRKPTLRSSLRLRGDFPSGTTPTRAGSRGSAGQFETRTLCSVAATSNKWTFRVSNKSPSCAEICVIIVPKPWR